MSRSSRFPPSGRYDKLRRSSPSTVNAVRAARRQEHAANARDRRLSRYDQNRPSMASPSHRERHSSRRYERKTYSPKRRAPSVHNSSSSSRRHHQHQMMEIDFQPPQSRLDAKLRQEQADREREQARQGKKSDIRTRLGRRWRTRGRSPSTGRVRGRSRGYGERGRALSTGSRRAAPRGTSRRRRRRWSRARTANGDGGKSAGGDTRGDDRGSGGDRRPDRFAGRDRHRRKRRGAKRTPVTKELLDSQLDTYMSKTKSYLNAELDNYMAKKTSS